MKQVTLWLDPDAMVLVQALAGANKISEFVRTAVEAKLSRRARAEARKEQ